MRTYIIEDITIHIGAEVVAVHHGGRTVIPKETSAKLRRLKSVVKEYWRNNYFRRHTKTYLSVKAAEIISRSIGIHTLYLFAREHVFPHLPAIYAFLTSIHWPEMILRIDLGFVLGLLTTWLIRQFKRSVTFERSERA